MNKIILIIFTFYFHYSAYSQTVIYEYTSNLAKLEGELEKKLGDPSIRFVNYSATSVASRPYFLQVTNTKNYISFLEDPKLLDSVRILNLYSIDFKALDVPAFDKFKNLKAIIINNCKNIDFEKLTKQLAYAEQFEQMHFKNVNFKDYPLDINSLKKLKVITFENCYLKKMEPITIPLEEFSIIKSKNKLTMHNFSILDVKQVSLIDCKLDSFPSNLSNTRNLAYLDLNKSKITNEITIDVHGFKELKYLDLTESCVKFNSLIFPDANEKIYVIRGINVFTTDSGLITIP